MTKYIITLTVPAARLDLLCVLSWKIVTGLDEALLNALGGVVVGALLVMSWDLIKFQREAAKRDKTGVAAIFRSLDDNRDVCQENIKALRSELGYLDQNKPLVEPLLSFDEGLWQLLRLQLPHQIATNAELLTGVGYLFQRIGAINRQIASRETYRHTNVAHDDFMNHMRRLDNALVADFESLWESMLEYEHRLFKKKTAWDHIAEFFRVVANPGRER